MSNHSPLEVAILRTLAYFDVFSYPLTVEELWWWLWPAPNESISGVSVDDVRATLTRPTLRERVTVSGEMVTLRGREGNIQVRRGRNDDNQKKWRRAESAARFVELVPFVKMVAVSNTLAINNARPESDIDFFIVTSQHHLWIARWLVTGIISLLGWRRHGAKIKNRICLSFYVTTAALDLAPLASSQPDPHFAFWASHLVPLMVDGDTYRQYQTANTWVVTALPNAWMRRPQRLQIPNQQLRSLKRFFEVFLLSPTGGMIEQWVRTSQIKKMKKNSTSRVSSGTTDVLISDDVLKFHEADRRRQYNAAVAARLTELGLR